MLNKVVVITGASGVLCAEFARDLAGKGYHLALIARHEETLLPIMHDIENSGGISRIYPADVTDENEVRAAHDKIRTELGPCDILINGAGGNHPCCITDSEFFDGKVQDGKTFFNMTREGFSHVFDLNLWGTVLPCQIFSEDMIGRDGCCILNISSMAAYSPLTKTPAYCASKAGISNFTQWLAVHLAPAGIRVNAIAPGFFLTNQNRTLLANKDGSPKPRAAKIISQTPMRRLGNPRELLGSLEFLIDETKSGFMTGCILPVDGGFSAYSGV
ncbi:MAG: SDR family oxidoreductase [Oscillospiraceae bacterium]|nr:SDR family oxidoreductase [Oscillospiraceae bacterium]